LKFPSEALKNFNSNDYLFKNEQNAEECDATEAKCGYAAE